jgi:hypothetical protein
MARLSDVDLEPPDTWVFSNSFKITDDACLLLLEALMPQHTRDMAERVHAAYKDDPMRVIKGLPNSGIIRGAPCDDLLRYKHLDWALHYRVAGRDTSTLEMFVLFPSRGDRLQFELKYKEKLPCQIHRINPANYEI